MKDILIKLKNPGTIIALVSLVIIILDQFGIKIDSERVMTIIKALCTIGIVLGVLNNPTTDDLDLPFINKKWV